VLFDPADAMNPAAANALLKTLEEPSSWWLMLLITQQPSRLPATIRSRCQRLAFSPPSEAVALQWLSGRVGQIDPRLVYGLSAGAPLKALELADREILHTRERMLQDLMGMMEGTRDPVAIAEAWHKAGTERALEWLSGWALDMARLQAVPEPPLLFNPDKAQALGQLAEKLASRDLHRLGEMTLEARSLVGSQVNAHLLLEGLLLEWANLVPSAGSGMGRRTSRGSRAQR